jgi:hypothetical protein
MEEQQNVSQSFPFKIKSHFPGNWKGNSDTESQSNLHNENPNLQTHAYQIYLQKEFC